MKKLKLAFVNPPHMDWCLANNLTWVSMQSFYKKYGKYSELVEWQEGLYKWNTYQSDDDVISQVKEADVILFSSYVWNYEICDRISKKLKESNPNLIVMLGGPHIGTKDPELLSSRTHYDYICQPTKPGEVFILDWLDNWFDNKEKKPMIDDISWALGSFKKRNCHFLETSLYSEHFEYFKKAKEWSDIHSLEPLIVLETTRGCPFKCTFCEWGGGIDTKIIKKDISVVKKDIDAIHLAGYKQVYLADANFGAFEERDFEILKYAYDLGIEFIDVSTLKTKDLSRKTRLIDRWFEIVGKLAEKNEKILAVPHISIQSLSDKAMEVCKRLDLSAEDKIKLSEHINYKCQVEGYPIPNPEFILAMPGSTKEDFYREFEIIWNFKCWGMIRHQYMFLPDSEISNKDYCDMYDIKLVSVLNELADEEGEDNVTGLYKDKKYIYKTAYSCFSYTKEDLIEMFFMNIAGPHLLKNYYSDFESDIDVVNFLKECYNAIIDLEETANIMTEIADIFNPLTPPRCITRINGEHKDELIKNLIDRNKILIYSFLSLKLIKEEKLVC